MNGNKYIVIEFYGTGDPFFGGTANDRPLGKDGSFITGSYHISKVAEFETKEQALAAADAAPNKREGGKISASIRAATVVAHVDGKII